jgi:hypothetical protein
MLVASRSLEWNGNRPPPQTAVSATTALGSLPKWDENDGEGTVTDWLQKSRIQYDTDKEDIVLLCPDNFFLYRVRCSRSIVTAILHEYRCNATHLKMRIETKQGNLKRQDGRHDDEQTSLSSILASRQKREISEVQNFFGCKYLKPSLSRSIITLTDMKEWEKIRRHFNLPPTQSLDSKPFKIRGIQQPLRMHHLACITYCQTIVQDLQRLLFADERRLDDIFETSLLL